MPMPSYIRTMSDLVQVLTGCSSSDASRASAKICQSPEAAGLLAKACGVSTGGVGMGGTLIYFGSGTSATGVGTVAGVPTALIGVALATGSGLAAKRFCSALVHQTGLSIDAALLMYLLK